MCFLYLLKNNKTVNQDCFFVLSLTQHHVVLDKEVDTMGTNNVLIIGGGEKGNVIARLLASQNWLDNIHLVEETTDLASNLRAELGQTIQIHSNCIEIPTNIRIVYAISEPVGMDAIRQKIAEKINGKTLIVWVAQTTNLKLLPLFLKSQLANLYERSI
ncbi:MAG: hypothetical protein ABIH87_02785 [bacterium]